MTLLDFLDTLEPGIEPDYETLSLAAAKQQFDFTDIRYVDPAIKDDLDTFLVACK